ncbi:MAG: hypothetical protein ABIO43_10885 [Sphingomicrobium sp.]
MRLLLLVIPLLLAGAPAVAVDPRPAGNMPVVTPGGPKRADCPAISRYEAMKDRPERAVRNLSELPPGDHYKAVYRRIDGCVVPIIANQPFNGPGDIKLMRASERPAR